MSLFNIISGGLLLGLSGSFHCIGMCGPLMMMRYGKAHNTTSRKWMTLHHAGRIISYLALTLIFFGLGKYSGVFTIQQGASWVGGCIFLLGWIPSTQRWMAQLLQPIRNKIPLSKIEQPWLKHFTWGLFNGTLPCGWVYSAIGISVMTGNMMNAIIFMTTFGLANSPALVLTAISSARISQSFNASQKKWARWGFAIIGILFILRGSNLGIPYLSPQLEKDKMSCCSAP